MAIKKLSAIEEDISLEQSMELAIIIEKIKIILLTSNFDKEYAKKVSSKFLEHSANYDASAVLQPQWNEHYSQLSLEQGRALAHLANFVESLEKCTELKEAVTKHTNLMNELSKIFEL